MRKAVIFFCICSLTINCIAQENKTIDSLLSILQTAKEDSNKVYLYLALADGIENTAPERAKQYVNDASELSRKINFPMGMMKSYRHFSYLYAFQSKFDSVLYYNQKVLLIARQQKDLFNTGAAYFNIGTAYRYLYELDSAVKYTLEGASLLDGKGYYNIESSLNDGLQSLYMTLTQYDKAILYGEKAVALGRKQENKQPLVNALNNLGLSYVEVNREADAKKVYSEALAIATKINYLALVPMLLNNLSDIAIKEGDFEPVLTNSEKAIAIAHDMQDEGSVMNAKAMLSAYYLYKKDFKKAVDLANEVQTLAEKNRQNDGKIAALGLLSKIAFANGDFKKGFLYEKEKTKVENAVFTESVKQREVAMRVKFESEKKDNEIAIQKNELQKKNLFNYILIGGAATILIISLLGYRTYTQKQKLQQQRITELETQQQLAAAEAVLKGEEKERTRLAKDLHDGLGGMLSGIKHSLHAMKGNLIMTPENAQAFERSMDMLDSSIQEMRRVAHNLMPEALVKFGLDTAVKDLCNDINQSGALKISYQSIGLLNADIEQTTAITIYRIIQELINNTMKHASAANAIVQISKTDDTLSLTVEDDGAGFDTRIIETAHGMGWNNIKKRVEFLKGKLDVNSSPRNGVSVHIEFNT